MGSSLGKLGPSSRSPAQGTEVPLGRLECPPPATRLGRVPWALRGPPAAPASALGGIRRPSYRSPGSLKRRFLRASWRRNPGILQTLWSFLGTLTSLCWPHSQRKQSLSAHHLKVSHSSGRSVSKLVVSLVQEQAVTFMRPTKLWCPQDPGAEKAVWRGMVKQEEDRLVLERQDHQKRGPDGTGRSQSAFRPVGVHGGESSFLPKPGPLKRSLHSKSSEDNSIKMTKTPFLSSCTKRNAITSSYSSTQGFPPLKRRRGPATSQSQLTCTSTERVSQEAQGPGTSASAMFLTKVQCEKDSDVTSGQKRNLRDCPTTSNSSRPRKRRIPLLRPRRGDPLVLPPFPQPGYRVTAEDLDREKRAALQRINISLRGEKEANSGCRATQSSGASTLPAAEAAPPAAAPPAPTLNQQWRTKQDSLGPLAVLEHAGVATPSNPMCGRKPSSPGPLFSSLPPPLPGTLSHSLPSAPFTLLISAPTPSSDTQRTDLSSGPPIPSRPAPSQQGLDVKMGSRLPHLPAPAAALPAAPRTFRMESPTPMCVDSPVSFLGTPSPAGDPNAPLSHGLTIAGSLLSTSSSASTTTGVAPQPGPDVGVTPMDISLPSQTLLQGPPLSTSRPFKSAQALHTHPGGSTASAIDTSRILAAPAPASGSSSIPGQPALSTTTGSALGGLFPTTSTLGTHVTTQPALGATPALSISHATTTSGFSTSMPGTVTNRRPKGRRHWSPGASTTPGRSGLQVSATPMDFGSRETVSDLSSKFGALGIGSGMSGAPSTPNHNRKSLVLNTRGSASQSTPTMKIRHSKTKKNPVTGGTTAPTISQTPSGLAKQRPFIAGGGPSTPESKASSSSMTFPTIPLSNPASGKGKAKKSLASMAVSSPAQSIAGDRNARPSTSSFSSGSGTTKLKSKRK